LFTQALKSTGEVEDGEYDWMKLNNGKGWEMQKSHSSAVQQLHHNNAGHSSTAVLAHGQPHGRQPKTQLPVDHHRLNADLPKPGATRGPPGRNPRDMQQGKYGHPETKRKSVGELAPTEGASMANNFQHSQPNLAANRTPPVQSPNVQQPRRQEPDKPSMGKKLANIFCCGAGS
jgi:casein kinase 1